MSQMGLKDFETVSDGSEDWIPGLSIESIAIRRSPSADIVLLSACGKSFLKALAQ